MEKAKKEEEKNDAANKGVEIKQEKANKNEQKLKKENEKLNE